MHSQNLLIGLGFTCLAASVVLGYFAIPEKPEQLMPLNAVIDIGEVRQAETVESDFELINRFRKPLEIAHVGSSCGCTVAEVNAKYLQAGERMRIRAVWKTGVGRGENQVRLTVESRVEGEEHYRLTTLVMRANIIPDFDFEPGELVFTDGVPGQKTVRLRANQCKNLNTQEAYASHRSLSAQVSGDNEVVVKFDPKEWTQTEDFVPYVAIKTNSPREPLLRIFVRIKNSEL